MEQTIYADRKPASTIAANLHHATYRFQCNMGMVNGIASIVLYEVYQNIRESKQYKQQVKKNINAAVKALDDHQKFLKEFKQNVKLDSRYTVRNFELFDVLDIKKHKITKDEFFQWYEDIGTLCYSRNRRQIDNLRNAIAQVFSKHELQHRDVMKELVFADTVLNFSLDIFDGMIRYYVENEDFDYTPAYKPFAMTKPYELVHEAACSLGRLIKHDDVFKLADAPEVQQAMKAFSNAIFYDFTSATSVDEAIEANKNLITKSRYRGYKEKYNALMMERNGKLNNEYTQW